MTHPHKTERKECIIVRCRTRMKGRKNAGQELMCSISRSERPVMKIPSVVQINAKSRRVWENAPVRTSRRGHFWVPGERVTRDGKTYQRGPMFVDWEAPEQVTQPYPVILVHGGLLQATE